jgi:hypothetical protein
MERRDWPLLVIAYGDGHPISPVQLQKSLFLLGRNAAPYIYTPFYEFTPYDYGPFDSRVYEDCDRLAADGYVAADRIVGRSWPEYTLTERGAERVRTVENEAPKEATTYLRSVVQWARSVTFQQLVTTIYDLYPEQRKNSVFRG